MAVETRVYNLWTKALGQLRRYTLIAGLYSRTLMRRQAEGVSGPAIGVTRINARVAWTVRQAYNSHPEQAVAQLTMRIIRPALFDLTWLDDDMFLENTIFPHDISYNSDGAEVFSTDVNVVDSGHEQRISHWDEPLMEYNVAYGVRTMEQLHDLKRLFRAVKGQRYGFRFRDPMDYTSSFAVGDEARSPDPVTPFDQVIGTGDGANKVFQLVKSYDFGGQPAKRTIRKPEQGTVVVAVSGVPYPAGTYSVDHTTGLVTLGNRVTDTLGGTVTMTRVTTTVRTIGWDDASSLDGFVVGDWVTISGFDNTSNIVPEAEAWQITQIDNTGKLITLSVPAGHDTTLGVNETKVGAVITLATIEAPPPGAQVTAGYKFHIPVRFMTDRLPIQLEDYGIGSATEVKLIELRGDG